MSPRRTSVLRPDATFSETRIFSNSSLLRSAEMLSSQPALLRIASSRSCVIAKGFSALERVYDLTCERIGSDGIDREVPACQILSQVVSEAYLGMPAPLGVLVGPVGRYLNLVLSYGGRYGPEALSHRPKVLCMRPKQRLYPRRMRVGRRVRVDLRFCRGVRIRAQEQCPPHDPTNQVELVPGIPERLTET